MADKYEYCVSNDGAMACITSNQPLTPAEVESYIYVSPEPVNNEIFNGPVPQDQPWYRDLLDTVTGWVTDRSVMDIVIMVAILGVVIALVRYARSSDLADDAYEAEDYIEDLNDDAYDRAYSLAGEISEEEEEE